MAKGGSMEKLAGQAGVVAAMAAVGAAFFGDAVWANNPPMGATPGFFFGAAAVAGAGGIALWVTSELI